MPWRRLAAAACAGTWSSAPQEQLSGASSDGKQSARPELKGCLPARNNSAASAKIPAACTGAAGDPGSLGHAPARGQRDWPLARRSCVPPEELCHCRSAPGRWLQPGRLLSSCLCNQPSASISIPGKKAAVEAGGGPEENAGPETTVGHCLPGSMLGRCKAPSHSNISACGCGEQLGQAWVVLPGEAFSQRLPQPRTSAPLSA